MNRTSPTFTMGIEEEYLLVDPVTRDLVPNPPQTLMRDCEQILGKQVAPELLTSQIEIGTGVCRTAKEARDDLSRLRRAVSDCAQSHGLKLVAASTHPFAKWADQKQTEKERYKTITEELEHVARRALIGGMHVHIGVENPDLRIDLMNQVRYFLPHLLVLSTSSPFWQGTPTGLMCYRLSVFHDLPRTGTPDRFESFSEFERMVDHLVSVGAIPDGTKLWWDIRPSARFPTLEMRITDVCTRLEDAVTIAALFQCLLRMLYRLQRSNQRWRIYPSMLMDENRWRAQRYGVAGELIDFGKWEAIAFPDLLDEMLELVKEDADALDCMAEVAHAREIVSRGTSADTQLHVYNAAISAGADEREALNAVVDWLIEETVSGL